MLQNCSEFSSQLCKQKEWTPFKKMIGLANPRGQEHFYPKAKRHLALHPLRQHITWKQRAAQLAPCSCLDAHLYSSLGWAISTMSPSLMCGNTLGFTTSSSSERQLRDLRQQATTSAVGCWVFTCWVLPTPSFSMTTPSHRGSSI